MINTPEIDWDNKKRLTVVYLTKKEDGKVFIGLAIKKRKIGAGLYNGYGGGIKNGQTIRGCAVAEVLEECGVLIPSKDSLKYLGRMTFHNTKNDSSIAIAIVHFFLASEWQGEPKESEEMGPIQWFPIDQLPFEQMMSADREFVPPMLANKKIEGVAHYGKDQRDLIGEVEMHELDPETDVD